MRLQNLVIIVSLVASALAGCRGGGSTPTQPSPNDLTVLAGSELSDLEPLLPAIRDATGLNLKLTYIGTLDGAEKLAAGDPTDLAWFSLAKYLTLLEGTKGRVLAQEKIMLSPVILGVKQSKARAWGWEDNPNVTWRDIAAKSGSGDLKFAMTNPAASNSGFTALIGVASALSGKSDALQVSDINNDALKTFFKGQALTAGSSGWLSDAYVREQDRLDGMINYESVLLTLNQGSQLHERLDLIYPKEGIITADYPLLLVNESKRDQYNKLVTFLKTPDFQKQVMEHTLRRPVNSQVPLSSVFSKQVLVELPFPASQDVIDKLLFGYLDVQRVPSHAIFVLDLSGSMAGERLDNLKKALINLTGADTSLTGQFARFRGREKVTLITFSSQVLDTRTFTVDNPNPDSPDMQAIRDYVNSLNAGGQTAIFSALQRAYQVAADAMQTDPQRYYSVVLMTDGENNSGISQDEFLTEYRGLPDNLRAVKTFTVLFGEGQQEVMQAIADETGGRVFNAKTDSLSVVFKQIRGYQ